MIINKTISRNGQTTTYTNNGTWQTYTTTSSTTAYDTIQWEFVPYKSKPVKNIKSAYVYLPSYRDEFEVHWHYQHYEYDPYEKKSKLIPLNISNDAKSHVHLLIHELNANDKLLHRLIKTNKIETYIMEALL